VTKVLEASGMCEESRKNGTLPNEFGFDVEAISFSSVNRGGFLSHGGKYFGWNRMSCWQRFTALFIGNSLLAKAGTILPLLRRDCFLPMYDEFGNHSESYGV
jgi:hypothetical protein